MALAVAIASSTTAYDPKQVAASAIGQLVQQPRNSDLWSWSYGPGIQVSAMYEIAAAFDQPWAAAADEQLDYWLNTPGEYGYNLTHNLTSPWGYSVGDGIGLYPIAYLSRALYYGEPYSPAPGANLSVNWRVALTTADKYVLAWPKTLPDGTISRDQGWTGQPDVNASFLWSDDQFMGTTLLARLGALGVPLGMPNAKAYLDFVARQQVQFAGYMQDATTGLYHHGYNHATTTLSCCYWGRANGWIMMAHAEIVSALSAAWPSHPQLPAILAIWRAHAAGLLPLQNATDGRWHQVLDHPETYLETSITSMTLYSLATGVMGGWLDKATFDGAIRAAWPGVAAQVAANGTVASICTGTGIGTDVGFYEARPTPYAGSSPGLGSVFRAALAYERYVAAYGA